MKVEKIDGVTVYSDIYTEKEETWNILERADGSISVYSTLPNVFAHYVIYDTLDKSLTDGAKKVLEKMVELAKFGKLVDKCLESAK